MSFSEFYDSAKRRLAKLSLWFSDHYHLLFKSAADNHLRIHQCHENPDGSVQCDINFSSYTDLKKYQKKLRRMTVSLSSAVAMVVVAFIVAPYVMNPSRSSANSFVWSQSNWETHETDPDIETTTNKTTWAQFFTKDAGVSATDSVALTANLSNVTQTNEGTTNAGFNQGTPDFGSNNTVVRSTGDAANVGLASSATMDVGTGSDGAISIIAPKNINVDKIAANRIAANCADGIAYNLTALTATSATTSVALGAGCLAAGDKILLINLQGDGTGNTGQNDPGNINVGNYEILTVTSASGSTVNFGAKNKFYGTGAGSDSNIGTAANKQRVIIQRIPQYTDVNIAGSGSLTANAWNGTTGGVLVFHANGAVTVDGGGIDMTGKGYRGGFAQGESYNRLGIASIATNLGGGGFVNASNACNGSYVWGGAAYGTIGNGGGYPSSSVYGTADLSKMFFGSGGYASGGGIIFISANNLTLSGSVKSNGTVDSAGAGGSIYLKGNSLSLGAALTQAAGGAGYDDGEEDDCYYEDFYHIGAGGAGRIYAQYGSSISGTTNPTLNSAAASVVYSAQGTFTSGVINIATKISAWEKLTWNETLNGLPADSVKIRARSCDDAACVGEDSAGKNFATNCTDINNDTNLSAGGCVTAGDQYIQYRAALSNAGDTTKTPTLNEIVLNYYSYSKTFQKLISSPFNSGNGFNSVQKLTWTASNDTTEGTVQTQIRTAPDNGSGAPDFTNSVWCGPGDGITNSDNSCSATRNSTTAFGTTYYTDKLGAIDINTLQKDHSNDQWIQYATFLKSADGTVSPTISNVTTQYAYNVPPTISGVGYTQNADGTVNVPYTLSETYDDQNNISHGNSTSAIKVGLFYQPDSGENIMKIQSAIGTVSQTGSLVILNPNNKPIPTQGTMLIDNELIEYAGAVTGSGISTVTIKASGGTGAGGIGRGALMASSFPTTAVTHSANADVFFLTSAPLQTIGGCSDGTCNALASTGTPGATVSTSSLPFTWNPRADANNNLDGNNLTGMVFKVVANDADFLNLNTIGQSTTTTALPAFDLESPTVSGIANPSISQTTYYTTGIVNIDLTFSESIVSTGVTLTLSNGQTAATCPNVVAGDNQNVIHCQYSIGAGAGIDTSALGVTTINGTITDLFANVADKTIGAGENLSDQTNKSIIDTTAPVISITTPANDAFVKDVSGSGTSQINYTLNDVTSPIQSGSLVFARTAGTADGATHTCTLQGTALDETAHATFRLIQGANNCSQAQTALVSGAIYTATLTIVDKATNQTIATATNVMFDTTSPTVSAPTMPALTNNPKPTISWSAGGETGSGIASYKLQRKLTANNDATFADVGGATAVVGTSFVEQTNLPEESYTYRLQAIDRAGNTSSFSSNSSAMVIDTTAPILQSFTSSNLDTDLSDIDNPVNLYGTGDTINIQAVYNETLDASSNPHLTVILNNVANYQVVLNSVSGNTISGTYTILGPPNFSGHDASPLTIAGILPGSESAKDPAGNNKINSSVPTAPNNLADTKFLVVDTQPPILQSFSVPSGNYKAGDNVTITAHYNKSVRDITDYHSNVHVKLNADADNPTIDLETVSGANISGPYIVLEGDNTQNLKVTGIDSQHVWDIRKNELASNVLPSINIGDRINPNNVDIDYDYYAVQVDTTPPAIDITDNIEVGPVQSDTMTVNVTETNPVEYKYMFSTDTDCSAKSYAGGATFTSGSTLTFNTENNNGKYVCLQTADQAGNTTYSASSNPLKIDTTKPTGKITVDRSKNSEQIALTATDPGRALDGLQMRTAVMENTADNCNFVDNWVNYNSTFNLNNSATYIKVCAQYRDQAGNVSDDITTIPPRTPEVLQYFDVSDPADYRVFLSWRIPTDQEGSKGFYRYQIFKCSDQKDVDPACTPDLTAAPAISISAESTNYHTDLGLSGDNKYCYQLRFAASQNNGIDTDYSLPTSARCVLPSSNSSSVTKDVAIQFPADPTPNNELFANQATIHWNTINANDPDEALPADSEVCWRIKMNPVPNWNCRTFESYVSDHALTISKATQRAYDLVPDTEYEYKVRSKTPWNKEAELVGPNTFVTKNGPVITNINPDPVGNTSATITWTTKNKDGNDLASSSDLYYASAVATDGSLVNPTQATCDSGDVVSHTCQLGNSEETALTIGTQYYYYVESISNGATARDSAEGQYHRFTTLSDSTPPVITPSAGNPLIVTDTQAAIAWETNEKSTSWLLYDTASHVSYASFVSINFDPDSQNPYASNLSNDTNDLAHTFIMSLDALNPETKYYYRMVSQDTSGNVRISGEYDFTTLQVQQSIPALINPGDPLIAQRSDSEAVVYLPSVNAPATSKLCYSDSSAISDMSSCANHIDVSSPTQAHYYHLTNLTADKTYYIKTKITDANNAGNIFTSNSVTFTTKKTQLDQNGPLTSIGEIEIPASMITDTNAVAIFTTDQPAVCYAKIVAGAAGDATGVYDNAKSVFEDGYDQDQFNLSHSIHFTDLLWTTKHFIKAYCHDNLFDSGQSLEVESGEKSFTTLKKGLTQSDVDGQMDKVIPEISSVALAAVTGENATITWTTNENANSLVAYEVDGTDFMLMSGDYAMNSDSKNYAVAHSVDIKGLIASTKYLFTVISTDASGNIAQSSQSSFTTKAPSSLSSVKIVSAALGQATVTWSTGSPTTSVVEYGETTSYGQKKADSSLTKEHSISLSGLKPGEVLHLRVLGEDSAKNLFASSDMTFQPKAPPKISDFKVDSINEHGATIKFVTNIPTDALITYTGTANKDATGIQGNPSMTQKHELAIKNLEPGTEYALVVKVRDEEGNETQETFPSFTTTKDTAPPVITNIRTDSALAQNEKVQAIISWATDEMSTGSILYSEGRNGEQKPFVVSANPSFSHVGVITAFKPGTVYYFHVESTDISNNTAKSTDFALLTPKQTQNIIQIIAGNFQQIFGWAKF